MRMPRPRLSIWMMMLAVAIFAAGLGYIHHRRSAAFRLRAEDYARKAAAQADRVLRSQELWEAADSQLGYGTAYLANRDRLPPGSLEGRERLVEIFKRDVDMFRALFAHYHGLEEKYRRAAAFPWLPIAPDPPPPAPRGMFASPPASREPEDLPPGSLAVTASLTKGVFELRENLILGGVIPLTVEYRNRSDRPITICPIGLVVVTDSKGGQPKLTGQGVSFRQAALSPSETRREHSAIVIEPGDSYRDVGLDLTSLYLLPTGRYSVQVSHEQGIVSNSVSFEVRRAKSIPGK